MANTCSSPNSGAMEEGLVWILNEAKSLLKTDEYAAKTWMLVGKTLYPRCFTIRFEIYSLEKISRKVAETSLYLEELLTTFYKEDKVWEEVLIILSDVLRAEESATDERVKFHRDIFLGLPRALQSFILGELLRRMNFLLPDIRQQSQLLLHVVQNYSKELPNQGAYLVDLWLTAEARDKEASSTPINHYREELVLKVLPKVMASCDEIPVAQVITWYVTCLEYFVFLAAQDYVPLANQGKAQQLKNESSSKVMPLDPWSKLTLLGIQVGEKISWPERTEVLFDSESSRKVKLKALDEALKNLMACLDQSGPSFEVSLIKLFALYLTFFFECLHSYAACLEQQTHSKSSVGLSKSSRALVEVSLLEDLDTVEDLRAKKPRQEDEPSTSDAFSCDAPSEMVEVFLLAVKSWSTLKSSIFAIRLSALHGHWLVKKVWPWMDHFNIDLMIYEGRYEEGLNICESIKSSSSLPTGVIVGNNKTHRNRILIQLICCAYRSCNRKGFLRLLQMWLFNKSEDPLLAPGEGTTEPPGPLTRRSDPYRFLAQRKEIQLRFVPLSDDDLLSYAIQAVIGCFWGVWKCQSISSHSDMMIGHMLVLMQHDVYRNESQICKLLEHIKRQGRFSYALFTTYVIDIILLEEFMFLQSPEGGLVVLDILPTSTQINQASRTVTRGVNKDRREEMKAAIEKQVLRCNEDVDRLLRTFLVNEAEVLTREFVS